MAMPYRLPPGPCAVLDWNWLRQLPKPHQQLPSTWCYLVPDNLFAEIAGCTMPDAMALKIREILIANRPRFFIGHNWGILSTLQTTPTVRLCLPDAVNWASTIGVRGLLDQHPEDWRRGVTDLVNGNPHQVYERQRRAFCETSEDFTRWIREQSPDWRRQITTDSSRHEWIRRPEQAVELVALHTPRYNTPHWRTALARFPDRLAAGRWARILIWYALAHSVDETSKFGNNWDDAQYAFLASYAGSLVTGDAGLRDAVAAVSPWVKIHTNLPGCPAVPSHRPSRDS
jgi:hypothetical protein